MCVAPARGVGHHAVRGGQARGGEGVALDEALGREVTAAAGGRVEEVGEVRRVVLVRVRVRVSRRSKKSRPGRSAVVILYVCMRGRLVVCTLCAHCGMCMCMGAVTCGGEAVLTVAALTMALLVLTVALRTVWLYLHCGSTDHGHLRQRGGLERGWVAEEEPIHGREQHLVRVGLGVRVRGAGEGCGLG